MEVKILNIEPDGYSNEAREILSSVGSLSEQTVTGQELIRIISHYQVLITRLGHYISRDIMSAGVNLKAIATATTGLDHIDIEAALDCGIKVISLKGETAFLQTITATAEHSFGLILSICRKIPFAFNDVLNGNWRRDAFKGIELKDKTLGIVGYGRLGRMVANYGLAFGMKVIVCDPKIEVNIQKCSFEEILRESDFISIHVPLNLETMNMFGNKQFSQMKHDAYLINTSRGDIIDEEALLNALDNRLIAGAAIDVILGELSSKDNKIKSTLIDYAKKNNNLIITPHIGGATVDSMHSTEIFIAGKIKDFMTHSS
ncbi:MAG: hydroxyacid dehydrogenase [Nitrospirae bacterium]|nr:hydroxyacid dehydrogenase [Nitrospirota bacterium]